MDPMAGAGNGGHQAIQLGSGTLGFQVHCAVPVVFHPAGQIQQLGGILRTVAEANPLHAAGKMPVAAFHGGAHSAGSFCGSLWMAGFGSKLFSRAVPDSSHATNSVIRMTESIGCSTKFSG